MARGRQFNPDPKRVSWDDRSAPRTAPSDGMCRPQYTSDSAGFDSGEFSNYEYSDSYEDDFRSPYASTNGSAGQYSYTGRRGYGYQPQPSARASYESMASSLYDSRDSR